MRPGGRQKVRRALQVAALCEILVISADGVSGTADAGPGAGEFQVKQALDASKRFYLELDVGNRQLRLVHSGLTMTTYVVEDIEWGNPRLFFIDLSRTQRLESICRWDGRLDPARHQRRQEVRVDPQPTAATPMTPEDVPLPKRTSPSAGKATFRLRYADGFVLLIHSRGSSGPIRSLQNLWNHWEDVVDVVAGDHLRVRVTLSPQDARRLYRSVPEGSALLLLGWRVP